MFNRHLYFFIVGNDQIEASTWLRFGDFDVARQRGFGDFHVRRKLVLLSN